MALRSGYKGFKKLINGLKVLRPGVLGIDIGTGLSIGQDGKLNVIGVDVTVAGNPEEAATAGDLTKLQIGDDIFNVPDTTYSNATTTEAGLMSTTDKEKLDGLNKSDYFPNKSTTLSSTDDLDDVTYDGFYSATTAPLNVPEPISYFNMLVMKIPGTNVTRQIIYAASGSSSAIYYRTYSSTGWKNWVKFTGTEIVPTP